MVGQTALIVWTILRSTKLGWQVIGLINLKFLAKTQSFKIADY